MNRSIFNRRFLAVFITAQNQVIVIEVHVLRFKSKIRSVMDAVEIVRKDKNSALLINLFELT